MGEVTWEDIADWYAAKLAAGSPIHRWALTVLLAETGDVRGESVLDLGCGEGLIARGLAERGAHVTGTLPHPCSETPHATWIRTADNVPARLVSAYYDEVFWRSSDQQGVRRVGNYHRTLSTYINVLINEGFVVAGVAEPRPSPEVVALHPGRAQVPLLLLIRGTRPAA